MVFMFFGCFGVRGRVIAYYRDKKYNLCLGFVIKSQAVLSKSVCNSTESDQRQNLEGLTHQLYTFAVCFQRTNFNLLGKKKKISGFCADCTFLHGVFCQLCVLCHNNLFEITTDYSQSEHS